MKIGQSPEPTPGITPPAKRPGPETEAAAQAKTAARATPAAGTSVTVSTLGRTLQASRQATAGDVDQAKVERIRSAIADGSDQVDAEAIADKMLANAEEMLQRQRNAG